MQHTISLSQWVDKIGPQARQMVEAIEACVHCGFCLPVCPTYQVLGEEMDSPRGRIVLMKSAMEGGLSLQEAAPFIDRCLACQACVTACPSGVQYNELVSPFRAYALGQTRQDIMESVQHAFVNETLPYPGRFRSAAILGRAVKPFQSWMPEELASMLLLLPDRLPTSRPLPNFIPAKGTRRARVALLAGCVQQALAPEINWATLRVLASNGVEVIIPQEQGCCGAILMHTGELKRARQLARKNFKVFPPDVDAILTNAAGCGSGMKEYGFLFMGLKDESLAEQFAEKVQDVSVFLDNLGLLEPPPLPQPLKAAYHDACHLVYAQGVAEPPRRLLTAIPNLTLLEIDDGGLCCGSAGTYNLEQPEIAGELGRRKAQSILQLGSEAVVAGNIGCIIQIRLHLKTLGKMLPVFHTLELLDMAYSQIS